MHSLVTIHWDVLCKLQIGIVKLPDWQPKTENPVEHKADQLPPGKNSKEDQPGEDLLLHLLERFG